MLSLPARPNLSAFTQYCGKKNFLVHDQADAVMTDGGVCKLLEIRTRLCAVDELSGRMYRQERPCASGQRPRSEASTVYQLHACGETFQDRLLQIERDGPQDPVGLLVRCRARVLDTLARAWSARCHEGGSVVE